MPILWNNEILKPEVIEKYVDRFLPKGKNKLVTFSTLNAQPFRVISTGKTLQKMGSEKQIPAYNRTTIEGLGSGIMRYYEGVNDVPNKMGGFRVDYSPNYLTFFKHNATFDASQNKEKFFFLLFHSANIKNSEAVGGVPEFQFNEPTQAAAKTVASSKKKAEAFVMLEHLREKNKPQLRAFYETFGLTDYEDKFDQKDWDGIMAPLYAACEADPEDALKKMNDAGLDIVSLVMQAEAIKIIKCEGKSIYWHDHIKTDLKKRKITDIPSGKQSAWQEWFATNYLRGDGDLAAEISVEIKAYQLSHQ